MVNYDKSTIYKLCCKDPKITDIYVGSTTNFTRRKNEHKKRCNNENDKKHNLKVYKTIREHGGFGNWDMVEIEKYCATDRKTLHMRERFWLEELGATLNMVIPTQSKSEYYAKNKEKKLEYQSEYYAKNREKKLQYQVEYQTKNKEKIVEYCAEYYAKNKERLAQRNKEYQAKNKERLAQRNKEYREKNKDKISTQKEEYRTKNRDQINDKMAEKVECECGIEIRRSSLTRHRKSKKHQTWVEQNTALHLE